jgi:hypothetical protein
MIDREVFLAAAKALRRQGFDAIDDENRINVIVDGVHRSVDTAEFSIWLVAEHDEKVAALREANEALRDKLDEARWSLKP